MTLTVKLGDQEQNRLDVIAGTMKTDKSDAIRKLINEKFEELQADKTLVERRGGHPQHLLAGQSNLSERDSRKAAIAKRIAAKAALRAR